MRLVTQRRGLATLGEERGRIRTLKGFWIGGMNLAVVLLHDLGAAQD